MVNIIKKNKLLVMVLSVYALVFAFDSPKAIQSLQNSLYYIKEMFEIVPVIFVLTALIETWVPKEVIENSFGEGTGIKGSMFAFLLGSVSAGPIYAAFPMCKTLLKKGASVSNIVIVLSTWAVLKIPMLINESKFLGPKFMAVRWVLTATSIFFIGLFVSKLVTRDEIVKAGAKESGNEDSDELVVINHEYCIGCGICVKIMPEYFILENKKAVYMGGNDVHIKLFSELSDIKKKCPAKVVEVKDVENV